MHFSLNLLALSALLLTDSLSSKTAGVAAALVPDTESPPPAPSAVPSSAVVSPNNTTANYKSNPEFDTKYPLSKDPRTMRGVNLGGWLVLEPWITPDLFQQFVSKPASEQAVDEYTFCQKLGQQECKSQLTKHWDTWVTRQDIEKLASYGLTHLRIPIGHWAYSADAFEPYVQGQAEYMEKAIGWAQEFGLKVIMDLHGAPGSQNGFDNSGRKGEVHFMDNQNSVDRVLESLRKMSTVAAKYPETVSHVQVLNEPANWALNVTRIFELYDKAYEIIKNTSPQTKMMVHDAFLPPEQVKQLINNKQWKKDDGVVLDTHTYHVFASDLIQLDREGHFRATDGSGKIVKAMTSTTIPEITGEWSLATADCAKYLNGFLAGTRWEDTLANQPAIKCPKGQVCKCTGNNGNDPKKWTPDYKEFLKEFARAQLSAYESGRGWMFWNFKTENTHAPQWDYMYLAENGYIPRF
ncbi:hypothetical protein H4219_006416 [Mycoemilia scoparia]|uniref:glucan 1,3-beta-glucosidase n=1 Tax=Mycoemilia scoparia TaxID=417184 RepID=A0A9W7ZNF5_9FUNG|nr:hypothetical protein H4219_006416 [Mycoemilia scoparia]